MATFNVADAKARFSELLQRAMVGEEVIIARDGRPLIRLVSLAAVGKRRKPGSAKGQIGMAPDFDATPEDFADYVPPPNASPSRHEQARGQITRKARSAKGRPTKRVTER